MSTNSALELQGILQRHPAAELFVEIGSAKLDGSLRVSSRDRKTIVYFEKGTVAFAASNAREHRLFSILIESGEISEEDLAGIDDYVNDMKLANALVSKGKRDKEGCDRAFARQVETAVSAVIGWTEGNWMFSPLARLKDGLRFDVSLAPLSYKHAAGLTEHEVLGRFKSFEERFAISEAAESIPIELEPREAFVLSRLDTNPMTIGQIKALSGLEGNEVMPVLYRLWLCGFAVRENWNRAFHQEYLTRIERARLQRSRAAISVEEEEKKKEEAARNMAEAEAKKQAEAEAREKAAEERKKREQMDRDADFKEVEISLEDFLERVHDAPTFYELFGIAPDAKPATIKRAYFSFARRFHPDVYQKKVDAEKHKEIQKAFSEIARAYETLRNEDTRELYDLRLGTVLEALKKKGDEDISGFTREQIDAERRSESARESFDRGMSLFDDRRFDEAAVHLGRAVQLEPKNAQFRAFFGCALSKDKRGQHKAEAELREAVALAPGESRFRLMLAELYVEIGLSVRATNELQKVLSDDPGNAQAKELLDSLKALK